MYGSVFVHKVREEPGLCKAYVGIIQSVIPCGKHRDIDEDMKEQKKVHHYLQAFCHPVAKENDKQKERIGNEGSSKI